MLRKKQVKYGLGIGILGILIFASFGYASPLGTVKLGAAELGTHAAGDTR